MATNGPTKGLRPKAAPPLWRWPEAASLCGDVAMWLCGDVAMQLCGFMAMWLCGHVAIFQKFQFFKMLEFQDIVLNSAECPGVSEDEDNWFWNHGNVRNPQIMKLGLSQNEIEQLLVPNEAAGQCYGALGLFFSIYLPEK